MLSLKFKLDIPPTDGPRRGSLLDPLAGLVNRWTTALLQELLKSGVAILHAKL
jgi:hypothetical protein